MSVTTTLSKYALTMTDIKKAYEVFFENSSSSSSNTDYEKVYRSTESLIEVLSYSNDNEILELLLEKNKEDIMSMPFWFRTLAFKLLVLSSGKNKEYIELAINDLSLFGGWDSQIEEYQSYLDS